MNHIQQFIESREAIALFEELKSSIKWNKINYFKQSVCHYEGNNPHLNQVLLQVQKILTDI